MEQLTLSLILRKFYVRNHFKGGNLEEEGFGVQGRKTMFKYRLEGYLHIKVI